MLGSFIVWAKGLSAFGKVIGFIAMATLSGTVMSAIASPTSPETPAVNPPSVLQAVDKMPPKPVITKETIEEEVAVPFDTVNQNDSSADKGTTFIKTAGVDGIKTQTYEITYIDGVQESKNLISEVVTKQPVNNVVVLGTYVKPTPPPPAARPAARPTASPQPTPPPPSAPSNCDPNYSGDCVPIASDVDCAGGSGNGPAYVTGPVNVIGSDIYGLDANNDGIGCE